VQDGHKLAPSETRVFSVGGDLHVFLQTYQRGATTMRPVSKAIPIRTSVPLRGMMTGRYECQARAGGVAARVPEREPPEGLRTGRALARALALAGENL
jgi:hypothetical protein